MPNLLLSTFIMMGLTFIIGFFVAGVIKIIANWADLINFVQLHREDITSLKKSQKPLLEAIDKNHINTKQPTGCPAH